MRDERPHSLQGANASCIKVCSQEQIAKVADLAREIWQEHYVPIVGQEQVSYMLERFQSQRAIAQQIAEGCEYYLLDKEGQGEGYVAVVPNLKRACLLLSKIYVRRSARGCGLGKKALQYVESMCRQRGIETIWLTVNKNNRDSIAWYSQMGFTNAGPTVQDIGSGFVMDDYQMEKMVDPQASTEVLHS